MPGRFGHDLFAHLHSAGEENIVKFLIQKGLVLRSAALHHRHKLGREAVRQNIPDDRRRGGGVGGGLHHTAVAGGNGPDEGLHGEQKGVVPGGHDERHPVGLPDGEAPGGELGQGGEMGPVPHPAGQPFFHKGQLGQSHPHLAHVALGGGFVQVGPEGGADVRLVGFDGRSQPFQGRSAGGQGQGGTGTKIGSLRRYKSLNVHKASLLWFSIP